MPILIALAGFGFAALAIFAGAALAVGEAIANHQPAPARRPRRRRRSSMKVQCYEISPEDMDALLKGLGR